MEPQRFALEKFSNSSSSINFHTWKSIFIANLSSKGLLSSLSEQNAEEMSTAKRATADKADAILLFELLNSIEKEPRQWALLHFPIKETPIEWAGKNLWMALKKRYDFKAIPQEIFQLKMKALNLKCHGNPKGYIQEAQDLRKRLFELAGDTMDETKCNIFDNDFIQSILLNLPASFQAFITIFRADPKMDFDEFVEQILLEERQMKPTHQEAANFFQPKGKFAGEKKKKKQKGTKNSLVDKTKLDISNFTSYSNPLNPLNVKVLFVFPQNKLPFRYRCLMSFCK